jgi:hypothetical protein
MSNTVWEIIKGVVILAAGAMITLYFRRSASVSLEKKELLDRVNKMDSEISTMKTQISPLWSAVQAKIAADLTHPSPQFKRIDALLAKLLNLEITPKEREELHQGLIARSFSKDPEVSDRERLKAKVMLDVMELVLYEAQEETKPQSTTSDRVDSLSDQQPKKIESR